MSKNTVDTLLHDFTVVTIFFHFPYVLSEVGAEELHKLVVVGDND